MQNQPLKASGLSYALDTGARYSEGWQERTATSAGTRKPSGQNPKPPLVTGQGCGAARTPPGRPTGKTTLRWLLQLQGRGPVRSQPPQPPATELSSLRSRSKSLHPRPFARSQCPVQTPQPRARCSAPKLQTRAGGCRAGRTDAPGQSSRERHPRHHAGCRCATEGKTELFWEAVLLFPAPAHSRAQISLQELGFNRSGRVNACTKRDRRRVRPLGPAG